MRNTVAGVVLAGCALAFAAPAMAQAPGVDLKINPRVGLYAPLTDLGDAAATANDIVAERSGTLAFGLGAELNFALFPLGIRANVDYVTGAEVSEAGVADPSETTMLAVAGDVMFRPLPKLIVVQPYLFAGGGIRQYDFDPAAGSQLVDATDPAVHVGGGLDLTLGPLALNAEAGDYISWYAVQEGADGEMQHDLFVSVGLVIGLL